VANRSAGKEKMGQQCSHMNIWALSCIIRANDEDMEKLLLRYDTDIKFKENPRFEKYEIDEISFLSYLEEEKMHSSDREILEDIFKLLDIRNRRIISIIDLLIAVSPLTARRFQDIFNRMFFFYDRSSSFMIEKHEIVRILKILNSTCEALGDRPLKSEVISDFVDSLYTSAGKIDGPIYYPDFIDSMSIHPIMELFISPQFQGTLSSKLEKQEKDEKDDEREREREENERYQNDVLAGRSSYY
jgi:Ca2+-binding EF-hand superfamily protein